MNSKYSNKCNTFDCTCGEIHKQYEPKISPPKVHRFTCLASRLLEEIPNCAMVFNVEETLLKSSSWFPFFMLVAFEGGGLLRALLLLIVHPLIRFLSEEWKLKIMVFICFFGVRRRSFRLGRTVLPKFLLEDVGYEGLEVVMKFGKRVAVSNFPSVMVEGFLKEYLGVEVVYGKKLKEFGGYYLGLMEANEDVITYREVTSMLFGFEKIIGMSGFESTMMVKEHILFNKCKDIFLVTEADKEKWQYLRRDKFPKPLIFHDGRLAFMPTPLDSLVMFIWLPFGVVLCIVRIIIAVSLSYKLSVPVLAFLGTSGVTSKRYTQTNNNSSDKGTVYVCNHRTLLDPIYISFTCGFHLTALTYSISKTSEILAPIMTTTLTRDKENDAEIMRQMLSKGSIVVCPEGTTCREPYLLRFSPLFAQISDNIVPVALDVKVSMFYGTTASGIKALDPILFLMNPNPYYFISFLEKLPKSHTCESGGMSKIEVAKYVQSEIGKALGFECTDLTRKDKYLMLAGNTGIFKN